MSSRQSPVLLTGAVLPGPYACPTSERAHPLTGAKAPITMGHEFCGRVVEAPSDSKLKMGQAVMVDPRLWCRHCHPCEAASTNLCEKFGFLGLSGTGGGLSEFVAVNVDNLHILSDNAPLRLAALIEPLAVAWHAVRRAGVAVADDTPILILGGGPIGIALCIVLRSKGAKKICISEPASARRDNARLFSDFVVDPLKENPSQLIRSMTSSRGINLVFDCAGVQAGMEEGLKALAVGGTYCNVAGWTTQVGFSLDAAQRGLSGLEGNLISGGSGTLDKS